MRSSPKLTTAERIERLRLLTVKQVIELTGLSPTTVRHGGAGIQELPVVRLGGTEVRYRLVDVEQWIARQTYEPVNVEL